MNEVAQCRVEVRLILNVCDNDGINDCGCLKHQVRTLLTAFAVSY